MVEEGLLGTVPSKELLLNLSLLATFGTEESGHCREVAFVGRWPLLEVQLYSKAIYKSLCGIGITEKYPLEM